MTLTRPRWSCSYLIDLSYLYTRLVATFSGVRPPADFSASSFEDFRAGEAPLEADPEAPTETTKLLASSPRAHPLSSSVREFMAM